MRTNNTRRITAVVASAAAISAIGACSNPTDATPASTSTVIATVTGSKGAPPSAPATHTNNSGNSDSLADHSAGDNNSNASSPGDTQCQTPSGIGAQIDKGISAIAPPFADRPSIGWMAEQTHASTCNSLNWTTLTISGATASSPKQILMFNSAGTWLGTGIKCEVAFQNIVSSTSNSVTVDYPYLVGDEPNAAPQGNAHVTYRWTGSGVTMDGSLPRAVTNGKC